jgi:hypothetical protein
MVRVNKIFMMASLLLPEQATIKGFIQECCTGKSITSIVELAAYGQKAW